MRARRSSAPQELIELFSLSGIARSNAVFDNDKLAWFNTEWIRRYSPQELLPLIEGGVGEDVGSVPTAQVKKFSRQSLCCSRERAVSKILPERFVGISAMPMNTILRR